MTDNDIKGNFISLRLILGEKSISLLVDILNLAKMIFDSFMYIKYFLSNQNCFTSS